MSADCDVGISVNNEDGMDAKPSSLGTALPNAKAGVFFGEGSAVGETKSGRASARNPNAGSGAPPGAASRPACGLTGAAGAEALDRTSGGTLWFGVAIKPPGCSSAKPARMPGNAGAVELGTAA